MDLQQYIEKERKAITYYVSSKDLRQVADHASNLIGLSIKAEKFEEAVNFLLDRFGSDVMISVMPEILMRKAEAEKFLVHYSPAEIVAIGKAFGFEAWRELVVELIGRIRLRSDRDQEVAFMLDIGRRSGVEISLDEPEIQNLILAPYRKEDAAKQVEFDKELKELALANKRAKLQELQEAQVRLAQEIAAEEAAIN